LQKYFENTISGELPDGKSRIPMFSALGRAFATYMIGQGKKKIVVGRDCRLTSDGYRDLLVGGMLESGMDIIDIGVCTSPLLYFAIRTLDRDGGIMITASHNPPNTTGSRYATGSIRSAETKSRRSGRSLIPAASQADGARSSLLISFRPTWTSSAATSN